VLLEQDAGLAEAPLDEEDLDRASASEAAMITPLPAASPSAFSTAG
jgi:hypothetical protein